MKSAAVSLMLLALPMAIGWGAVIDQAADEASIRQSIDAYVAAFNKNDSKALAAMWSPEAVYINPVSGEQVVGREAIEEQFTAIFAEDSQAKLSVTTHSIQFISPGVAVENGTAYVARPDEAPVESQYTAVYVKREGQWLLDRITEEEVPVVFSNYEHLKELEWMIGTWVDSDDQVTVTTSCQWTKNQNFLLRMFSVTVGDRVENSGMQIVGWDPAQQQIRSWVFDSDGGFGQGTWSKQGNAWHIKASGTASDGSSSSSMNIITYVDDNTFTWQSINRVAGGGLLPNVDEVIVRRQDSTE